MSRLFAVFVLLAVPALTLAAPLEFHLTFDAKVRPTPFTGRVYVLLFPQETTALGTWPNWFNPQPGFAKDVVNWKPGEKMILDQSALSYPVSLDKIKAATWTIQAVMDVNPNHMRFTTAPGNIWTTTRRELDPATTGPVELKLDRVYEEPSFKETERVKLVDIESKLLSDFHQRPTRMRAAVILPESYAKGPTRRFPTVYEIPGFSGTHRHALLMGTAGTKRDGVEVLHVILDPSCHHGHHVFADSANNGPVGRALIEELIPAIESKFRAIAQPAARLVTGHSSGGWSSLWLQVTYPDYFGGCWSTAPDPIDFRDFQRINIYRPSENMFTDRDGQKRPIARRGGKPILWYKDFSDMEEVMGHGGQLASFEAVFSERGRDGKPRRLWNRKTGEIDAEVARSWEKYDIRLILERNWDKLGPKLSGKVHVYMGDVDTFYLEGATRLLKEMNERLKGGLIVELFPGKDHGSLMTGEMRQRIAREMAASLKAARIVE